MICTFISEIVSDFSFRFIVNICVYFSPGILRRDLHTIAEIFKGICIIFNEMDSILVEACASQMQLS